MGAAADPVRAGPSRVGVVAECVGVESRRTSPSISALAKHLTSMAQEPIGHGEWMRDTYPRGMGYLILRASRGRGDLLSMRRAPLFVALSVR